MHYDTNNFKFSIMETKRMYLVMFKIIGGRKEIYFRFEVMSDPHAVSVSNDFYNRNGLIGRYYCETSSGKTFSVS